MSLKSLVTFSLSLASFSRFKGLFLSNSRLRFMGFGIVESVSTADLWDLSASELSVVDVVIESLSLASGYIFILMSLGSLLSGSIGAGVRSFDLLSA